MEKNFNGECVIDDDCLVPQLNFRQQQLVASLSMMCGSPRSLRDCWRNFFVATAAAAAAVLHSFCTMGTFQQQHSTAESKGKKKCNR